MAQDGNAGLCPDGPLNAAIGQLQADDVGGLATLAGLIAGHPLDPRLHFLKGSVLAGLQRYDEGRSAMARAIEIAPDFALARFQLGFLDLTSGRAVDAIGVWTPLFVLDEDEPLRVLAEGLTHLAGDNFGEAKRLLKKGMAMNAANPLINGDMQLILDEIENKPDVAITPRADTAEAESEPTPASATHQLLQQYRLKDSVGSKKH